MQAIASNVVLRLFGNVDAPRKDNRRHRLSDIITIVLLAVMRRMALNLLKRDQSVKVGLGSKRLKAGRNDRYLLQLLTQGLDAI